MAKTDNGHFMGMEKEPPVQIGPKVRGKGPLVHSHSMKPRRKIVPGKRHGRKTTY